MKDFLKNNGLWILAAAAVIAVALSVLSYFSPTSSPLVNFTHSVAAPFRSARTAVFAWFEDKQNYYRDTTALQAENEELKRRLAEMEEAVRQARADSEENAFLRELLGLRTQRRDLSDFETALLTERSTSNWASTLTLDKGSQHGIEVGDCVIDGTGNLVGQISEVGSNWSTVLNVIDTDTSLGAKVFRTEEICLAQGSFSLMDQGLLRLNYLPANSQLMTGDLVVTSGLGGYLPPDLVIGSVQEVQTDDSGSASYVLLAPAAQLDELTKVCVIKSFEIVN